MIKFGCTNKMFWLSQSEARAYHKRIKFKSVAGPQKRYYKCQYENHWHASSLSKKEYKKKIQKFTKRKEE